MGRLQWASKMPPSELKYFVRKHLNVERVKHSGVFQKGRLVSWVTALAPKTEFELWDLPLNVLGEPEQVNYTLCDSVSISLPLRSCYVD